MSNIPDMPSGFEFSIKDHMARSEFFLNHAVAADSLEIFNWLLMASVNSARAPIEIALTELDNIKKFDEKAKFLAEAEKKVRHCTLIATVRVHDFHRGAVHLTPGAISVRGPIKGKTSSQPNSTVGIRMDPQTAELQEIKTRNASLKYDRPLQTRENEVYDFAIKAYVPLHLALSEYLIDLKPLLCIYFPRIEWT